MKKRKPPKSSSAPIRPLPTYTVKLSRVAQKQLDRLSDATAGRITTKLFDLVNDPRPSGVKKLKGQENYRIRVGDYRVMYAIFDAMLLIEVVKVGQRGNFYDE